MRSKAFDTSKVGLGYIGNRAISQVCSGHYAFHNSVRLTRLQLPVLNSCLLYQDSLKYANFSDCCHSAHELGERHILPSVELVKQQVCVVSL